MSSTLAAILGSAAGGLTLFGILIFLVRFCLARRRSASRNSETGSSEPSLQEARNAAIQLSFREAICFSIEELSLATKNFSDKSLIGVGKFGEVYKGLLQDGMLVAIKKRTAPPSQDFINKARYLSSIRHRNLVTLLGYCQQNNMQFLVYEYISNGSVSGHLYGNSLSKFSFDFTGTMCEGAGEASREMLDIKHRLSIALGAATGLAHIHSLSPRVVHKDFNTSNVLVDENFIAKVADARLPHFLGKVNAAGSSSQIAEDRRFLAPEVWEVRQYSEKSDVYSFGVFLLELISGREASETACLTQNLVESVQNDQEPSSIFSIVDQRLGNSFTAEGIQEFTRLTIRCLEPSSDRRPTMGCVAVQLGKLLEKEVNLTTITGEGTPKVTLGSQLFQATT